MARHPDGVVCPLVEGRPHMVGSPLSEEEPINFRLSELTELTEVHINVIPKVSLAATFGLGNQCRTSRRSPIPSARH